MKKIICGVILLLLFLIVSCNDNERVDISDVKKIIKIPSIPNSFLSVRYSECFSDVRLVPLEDTLQSSIGLISKLIITKDGDIIVFDSDNRKIVRFDKDGKYLNNIGVCGHANNEYILPLSIAYDQYNDLIVVFDNSKRQLMYFDLEGNYKFSSDKLVWYDCELEIIDKDYLALVYEYPKDHSDDKNYVYEPDKESPNYKYTVINHKGTILWERELKGKDIVGFQPILSRTLSTYGKNILCKQEYSPIVYTFANDSVIPTYGLDFGEDAIPSNWLTLPKKEFLSKIKENNKTYCKYFFETNEFYVMNIIKEYYHICFLNKENENEFFIGNGMINDMLYLEDSQDLELAYVTTVLENVYGNQCYFIYNNESLDYLYSLLLKQKENSKVARNAYGMKQFENMTLEEEIEVFKKYKESNNPVIAVCTLKQTK